MLLAQVKFLPIMAAATSMSVPPTVPAPTERNPEEDEAKTIQPDLESEPHDVLPVGLPGIPGMVGCMPPLVTTSRNAEFLGTDHLYRLVLSRYPRYHFTLPTSSLLNRGTDPLTTRTLNRVRSIVSTRRISPEIPSTHIHLSPARSTAIHRSWRCYIYRQHHQKRVVALT